jgi:hypothetical protein
LFSNKKCNALELTLHDGEAVLGLEVLGNGDGLCTVFGIGKLGLINIQVLKVIDRPLSGLLGVGGRDTDATEHAEVLLQVRPTPVNPRLLEARGELSRVAVEDLTDGTRKLLGAPEGTVGDIDVDREGLLELVVKDGAEGGEDTLEGLNTTAKVEALFAALEERLLNLGILLRRPLAHDVVEKVDRVDALVAPRSLTLKEGVKGIEINLACPAQVDCMLVATLAWLGGTALFGIEVDGDTIIVALQTLARPEAVLTIAMVTQRLGVTHQASLLPSQTQRLMGSPRAVLTPLEWKIFFSKTRLV